MDLVEPSTHRSRDVIESLLTAAPTSPTDVGTLEMLVVRPAEAERDVLESGVLDTAVGLVGDTWAVRGSRRTADGSSHPDMQLNLMSTRVLGSIADRERWHLAGDQFLVDLDLTPENAPTGTLLAIGDAVIEVTDQPHTGCPKFAARFGADALRVVNTGAGKAARHRGVNARVIVGGRVRTGDAITVTRPA